MIIRHYIVGLRPVYSEFDDEQKHLSTYAFDWKNGKFAMDNHYHTRISLGKVDELTSLTDSEFWKYVEKLKLEKGL